MPTKRTARGLAKYLRRQLAAARRSGDARRIAAVQAEVASARAAATRPATLAEARPRS